MNDYTSKDCSTATTRLRRQGYEYPHHQLIANLLDEESYSLNEFRINNGSNYDLRAYNSENTVYDYSAYGDTPPTELSPPEEYDDSLIFDEVCKQGEFIQIPDYQDPCQ